MSQYTCKELLRTYKFFTTEDEVTDIARSGSPGEMTMAYFDIETQKPMQWWNQYQLAVEEGIMYSRHASQTLIGKELKSKCTKND